MIGISGLGQVPVQFGATKAKQHSMAVLRKRQDELEPLVQSFNVGTGIGKNALVIYLKDDAQKQQVQQHLQQQKDVTRQKDTYYFKGVQLAFEVIGEVVAEGL